VRLAFEATSLPSFLTGIAGMSALRLAGLCIGIGFLVALWLVNRRQRLRASERLVGSFAALVVTAIAIWPDSLNSLLAAFSFQRGGGGRLVGLLILAVVALFGLAFRQTVRTDRLEDALDRLVRQLAKREYRREHVRSDAPICVVIPAHNEADNIAAVLGRVPSTVLGLKTRILVVVDGATDQTEPIVRKLEHGAVSYLVKRGGGSALKAGYELALEDGSDIIVTLDGDGQHLPEEIGLLVQPILDDRADLVNGSRVLGRYERDSRVRAAGVILLNWLVSALMMRRITDCSNGFRAIRTEALQRLDLRQVQFHASETLIEAFKKGLRVVEVPITVRRRQAGTSKKGSNLRYAFNFARVLIGTWLR
jgi:GT2 family glycosyltransferase